MEKHPWKKREALMYQLKLGYLIILLANLLIPIFLYIKLIYPSQKHGCFSFDGHLSFYYPTWIEKWNYVVFNNTLYSNGYLHVCRVKRWKNSIMELILDEKYYSINYFFYINTFRHVSRRHYVHTHQTSVCGTHYSFHCSF